jgi:hypothetical protein
MLSRLTRFSTFLRAPLILGCVFIGCAQLSGALAQAASSPSPYIVGEIRAFALDPSTESGRTAYKEQADQGWMECRGQELPYGPTNPADCSQCCPFPDVMLALGREMFHWLDGAATGEAVSAALADESPHRPEPPRSPGPPLLPLAIEDPSGCHRPFPLSRAISQKPTSLPTKGTAGGSSYLINSAVDPTASRPRAPHRTAPSYP